MPQNTPTVKERVRAYLKANEMTQVDLAARLGITPSHLSDILSGKTPSLNVAADLETITGVPARDFVQAAADQAVHAKRVGA